MQDFIPDKQLPHVHLPDGLGNSTLFVCNDGIYTKLMINAHAETPTPPYR